MHLSRKMQIFCLLCIASLLTLDFFSKWLTLQYVDLMTWLTPRYPYGGIPVFENFLGVDFSINYVENRGSAFGLFSNFSSVLLIARIVTVIGLIFYGCFYLKHDLYALPLSMIIAGAIGNIIDCLVRGFVVDMFHFVFFGYDFAVFNVADSSICLGVFACLMISFYEKRRSLKAS